MCLWIQNGDRLSTCRCSGQRPLSTARQVSEEPSRWVHPPDIKSPSHYSQLRAHTLEQRWAALIHRIYVVTKTLISLCWLYSQSYGFFSSDIWMWELDHKEGWVLKNWSFRTMVLEKTLESPLDSKEIKPVHPKGNQPWIFIGRTDVKAEAPILWPPDSKSQLTGKDPDPRKDWRQKEKRATEDEMIS